MKIIITERQYKELISEETTGVDSFFDIIEQQFFKVPRDTVLDIVTLDDFSDEVKEKINTSKVKYKQIRNYLRPSSKIDDELKNLMSDEIKELGKSKSKMGDELKSEIQRVFDETGTKNIKFDTFKIPALGLSTPDGVILTKNLLGRDFYHFLFVLFHELAHQYQYKKYGNKAMLDIYFDEMSLDDAAKFMLNVEHVADEYAVRKLKQIIRKGLIPDTLMTIYPQKKPSDAQIERFKYYKGVPESQLRGLIQRLKEIMRNNNITDHEQVSEFMYNFTKGQI